MGLLRSIIILSVIVGLGAFFYQRESIEYVDKFLSSTAGRTLKSWVDVAVEYFTYFVVSPISVFLEYSDLETNRADKTDYGYGKYKKDLANGIGTLTQEELKKFDGIQIDKIYIAMMGHVFDVTKGKDFYGKDAGYAFFAGRDASRAYVTGQFDEAGLIDDIEGLSHSDYLGLDEWIHFYHKDYTFVGKLEGRYFHKDGSPTEYKFKTDKWIEEAKRHKKKQEDEAKIFPVCNSEWSKEKGSRFWCTNKSGGVERTWVGVPRHLYTPGKKDPRCVCVKDKGKPSFSEMKDAGRGDLDHPHLKEFENCNPQATECFVALKK